MGKGKRIQTSLKCKFTISWWSFLNSPGSRNCSTFVISPDSKGTVTVTTAQLVLPAQKSLLNCITHIKGVVYCLSWTIRWSPLGACGSPPCSSRSVVYRLSFRDPRCGDGLGTGCLAAGSHQCKSIIQQRVHGLPSLFNGWLWWDVLGDWVGRQAGELPQITWRWCLRFTRQVWIRLDEMERRWKTASEKI